MARSLGEQLERVKKAHRLNSAVIHGHNDIEIKEALDIVLAAQVTIPNSIKVNLALRRAATLVEHQGKIIDLFHIARPWKIASDTTPAHVQDMRLIDCDLNEELRIKMYHSIFFKPFNTRISEWVAMKQPELKKDFESIDHAIGQISEDESAQLQTARLNSALANFGQSMTAAEHATTVNKSGLLDL